MAQINFSFQFRLLLLLTEKEYKNYLYNGKTFFSAKKLYFYNEEMLRLLISNSAIIPINLQPELMALIDHLVSWKIMWEEKKGAENMSLDQEFVFESRNKFPKEAVDKLLKILT